MKELYHESQLMQMQASTLYVIDHENKLLRINEPHETEAPAIFIGKTSDSSHIYFKHDLSQFVITELEDSLEAGIHISDLCKIVEKYRPIKNIWMGPAYAFKENKPETNDPNIVLITVENIHLLAEHFIDVSQKLAAKAPVVGYIANDHAVSVCCSARKSDLAAEASLFTIPEYRGKGLAQKVVTRWSSEIFRQNQIPLYSTSWDNLSSQKVAQKLGLIQYGMDFSITVEL